MLAHHHHHNNNNNTHSIDKENPLTPARLGSQVGGIGLGGQGKGLGATAQKMMPTKPLVNQRLAALIDITNATPVQSLKQKHSTTQKPAAPILTPQQLNNKSTVQKQQPQTQGRTSLLSSVKPKPATLQKSVASSKIRVLQDAVMATPTVQQQQSVKQAKQEASMSQAQQQLRLQQQQQQQQAAVVVEQESTDDTDEDDDVLDIEYAPLHTAEPLDFFDEPLLSEADLKKLSTPRLSEMYVMRSVDEISDYMPEPELLTNESVSETTDDKFEVGWLGEEEKIDNVGVEAFLF